MLDLSLFLEHRLRNLNYTSCHKTISTDWNHTKYIYTIITVCSSIKMELNQQQNEMWN